MMMMMMMMMKDWAIWPRVGRGGGGYVYIIKI